MTSQLELSPNSYHYTITQALNQASTFDRRVPADSKIALA
jgi:hypothetical protein